jgi:pimeloyl-ACP methyl ester carboxylesterase
MVPREERSLSQQELLPILRKELAQIPGARLVLLPGAGHCFPLERFEETARELTGFFREAASRVP